MECSGLGVIIISFFIMRRDAEDADDEDDEGGGFGKPVDEVVVEEGRLNS
jgi:hypothetical protein